MLCDQLKRFYICKCYYSYTVPLDYNFISTHVDTRGNTQYFACKMPKFPMENIISTWRDVAFPHNKTWLFHKTRYGISMWHDQPNGIWDDYYYVPCECSYSQLKSVQEQVPSLYFFSPCILCIPANFFQLLILLGNFVNICSPYYNILEWHDQLITMWVCPHSNGAYLNTNKRLSWYFLSMHWFSLNKVCGGLNCTSISIRTIFKSGLSTCLSSMAKLILQCIDFLFIRCVEAWIALVFRFSLVLKVGVARVYWAWLSWYFQCIDFLLIRCVEAWIALVFWFVLFLKVGLAHVYRAWLSWYFNALIFSL